MKDTKTYALVHLNKKIECFELFGEECVLYGAFRLVLFKKCHQNIVLKLIPVHEFKYIRL